MEHLKLSPDVRTSIEAELGLEIPDPNDPVFEGFLDELKETRPDLAQQLVAGLEVEGAELPEEQQARRAQRRERRKNLLHRLFYSEGYEGEASLNKRKTLFIIVGLLIATLPVALVIDNISARRATASSTSRIVQATSKGVPTGNDEGKALGAFNEPFFERREPNVESLPDLPEAPVQPMLEPNPPSMPLPPPPGPARPRVAGAPPGAALDRIAGLSVYAAEAPDDPPLSAFTQSTPPTPLTSFQAPPQVARLSLTAPATQQPDGRRLSAMPLADEGQQSAPLSVMGGRPAEDGVGLTNTIDPLEEDADGASLTTGSSRGREADTGTSTTSGLMLYSVPMQAEGRSASKQPPVGSRGKEGVRARAEPQSLSGKGVGLTTRAHLQALQPGSRLLAHLVTGIAVTEGMSSPVVAKTPRGGAWCEGDACPAITWLGTAHLKVPNQVAIVFDHAVINGAARPVIALALSGDNLPGLAAKVSDQTPTVAQDLLRAAAGGVSDYVEALADRQTVTLTEENVIIQDVAVPPLHQFLLGRAAQLFDLPNDQTTVVRIAQVPPGTPFQVLYGVSPSN